MTFYDISTDPLRIQILANILQLDESLIPCLAWYSSKPISVRGEMCYQLNFRGFSEIREKIKSQSSFVLIDYESVSGFIITYFKVPDCVIS